MIKFFSSGNPDIVYQVSSAPKYVRDAIAAGEISIKQLHDYLMIKNEAAAVGDLQILGETSVQSLQAEGQRIIVKLFGGANARTVVEETVEGRVREALGSGRITREWLHEQISAWDKAHPDDKLLSTGSDQNLIEAVSTLGKAYFAGKIKDQQLPQPIAHFFQQLSAIFRQFFIRATKLKQSLKDGTLSPEFDAMLAHSLGFDGNSRASANGPTRPSMSPSGDTLSSTFSLRESSPERDARPLAPLRISTPQLQGKKGDWHKSVRNYIATYLQGKTITNTDSSIVIQFTSESKSEAPSKLRNEPSFRAAHEIHAITEQALHLGSITPGKGRSRDAARFDYFALPIEIDGVQSFAWFNTRQTFADGANIFYEFGLFKPKQAARAAQGPSANKRNLQPVAPQPEPIVSVSDFLEQIKDELPAFLKVASESTTTAAQAAASSATSFSIDTIAADVLAKRGDEKVTITHGRNNYPSLNIKESLLWMNNPHNGILGSFHNPDTNLDWNISGASLSKMVRQAVKDGEPQGSHRVRIAAAYHLPELITAAKGIEVIDQRNESNIDRLFDLFAPFQWRGDIYRLRIKGKVTKLEGNKAHSMRVEDIVAEKVPLGGKNNAPPTEVQPVNATAPNGVITLRQLFNGINPYSGQTFSISPRVDHQKISSILNHTYEPTTQDHLAARSFERSIRQSPQLLKEFGGHTPKARPISHLEPRECHIGAAIGAVFQKRVGLFDIGDVARPGGHYSPQFPESVFLNQNNEFPAQLVTGHELWHALTVEDVATSRLVQSLIAENVDNGRLDGALRKFEGAYGDHAVQEVAANIFATVLTEPQFWQELQTPYAVEIANALKALPENAAYHEANLLNDWPSFVKEVANLLRPKNQKTSQRSLLSEPADPAETSTPGDKPRTSYSLSSENPHSGSSHSKPSLPTIEQLSGPDRGSTLLAPNRKPSTPNSHNTISEVDFKSLLDRATKGERVQLPSLSQRILSLVKKFNKPLILKPEIAAKNLKHHPEISAEESARILKNALYNTKEAIQTDPKKAPNYWLLSAPSGQRTDNAVVELSETKDGFEIVGWYSMRQSSVNQKKRKAEREGGQVLIIALGDSAGLSDGSLSN